MVIRSNFSGNVSKTADSDGVNWNTKQTINLPTKSETETNSYYHYPKWSKIFFDAIYQTLINGGYEPSKNEKEYSISLWGFKFYVLSYALNNNYYYPLIAINGTNYSFYHNGAQANASCSDTSKVDYNFLLTLRGSEDVFCITCTRENYPTAEYGVIFLAKAMHVPTRENYFVFNNAITDNTNYFIKKSNLYDCFTSNNNCRILSVNRYYNYDIYKQYYGIGKGYNKIPLMTEQFDFIIKGMLCTTNDNILQMGNYYKIGNELYYSNNAGYSTSYTASLNYMYLYKVDTVADS